MVSSQASTAAASEDDGFLLRLFANMLTPGVQREAVTVIYWSLGALILTGLVFSFLSGGNIHVIVLTVLATGFLLSFIWYPALVP